MRIKSPNVVRVIPGIIFFLVLFLGSYAVIRDNIYSPYSFLVLAISLFLLVFIWIVRGKVKLKRMNHSLIYSYLVLVLIALMTTVLNDANFNGIRNNALYQLIFIILLFLLSQLYNYNYESWLIYFSKFMIIYSIFSITVALQLFFTGQALVGPLLLEGMRWPQLYGWYESPNFFINVIVFGIIGNIYLILKGQRSFMYSIILLVQVIAAILSGSKGGMLAIFASISMFFIIYTFFNLTRSNLRLLIKFIIILFITFIILLIGLYIYLELIGVELRWLLNSVIRIQSISNGTGRLELWANSIQIISKASFLNLVFGYGNEYIIDNFGSSTHNAHLKVIIEYGFLVYIILFFIYLNSLYLTFKLDKAEAFIIFVSLSYIWIRTLFNAGLFSFGVLGGSFIFIIFILGFLKKRNNNENIIPVK